MTYDEFYDEIFHRVNTPAIRHRTVDEFEGLHVAECSFTSDKGQRLAGYRYSKDGQDLRGTLIIAHGLGVGGQCVYMDTADYFASNGYLVFSYDATGVDKSEGVSSFGMQQGIIDLSHAIDYAMGDAELGRYPIALLGHSWGAFCAGSVLALHPEIRAVVSISGFNRTTDWFRYALGNEAAGAAQQIELIEHGRFGRYANLTASDGFAKSDASVMVIQSEDDMNVPEHVGYDLYYNRFKDDDRFTFRLYRDRGHLFIFYTDEARAYDRRYVEETTGELTEYGKANIFDKGVGYEIDEGFYRDILDFCNRYCE